MSALIVPESPLELLLIRHGESTFNRDGTGGMDSPLTDLGIEQAKRLGPWLAKNATIVALYSSTMLRARQTAELIAPHLHLPIQFDPELCEADFDIALTLNKFSDPPSAIGGPAFTLDQMTPDYQVFQSRVVDAIRKIVSAHESGTIAVVTHGGVIATLLRTIFGAHQVSVYADNTGMLLLRWMNQRWYLVFSKSY
jgi:broad specificity phosphatase PhoE